MLAELFKRPDQTVTAIADKLAVPASLASRYLRELNARGLLEARRVGKWVSYRPIGNPSVRQAAPLLAALRAVFKTHRAPVDFIFRQVTALTHPRRVQVIATLRDGPLAPAELRRQTRISRNALFRHLDKLERRGLVEVKTGAYAIARPQSPLTAALLGLAKEIGVSS